jgi:Ca2+-transporting ATPase
MQLFVVVGASFALQLAIHHLPALQALFGTAPISLGQCVAWLVLGAVPLGVLELRKVLWCRRAVPKPLEDAVL